MRTKLTKAPRDLYTQIAPTKIMILMTEFNNTIQGVRVKGL